MKDYSTLKINYFHNIDTKEKAYWLGFLYADGYVDKTGCRLGLCLSIKDEDQIDRFLESIGLNQNFKRYYGPYKTSGKSVQININNREFVSGLIKHGCVNKKSLVVRMPVFEDESINMAFLLGYYDGDGTSGSASLVGGSYEFFMDLKNHYNLPFYPKNHNKNVYKFYFGEKLKNELIQNYPQSMGRKYTLSNANYDIELIKKFRNLPEKECLICSKKFLVDSLRKNKLYCSKKCAAVENFKRYGKFEISKEELESLISQHPMTTIGKILGVSDNAVRKRARKLGIELGCRLGHWTKKKIGTEGGT